MPHFHGGGFHGGRGFGGGFGGWGGYGGYEVVPVWPVVIEEVDNNADDGDGVAVAGSPNARGKAFRNVADLVTGGSGSLVDAAKIMIPAPKSVQLTTELLGTNLAVTACVDGKCYRGVADLSGILAELEPRLVERARELHHQFHGETDTLYPPLHTPLVGRGGGGGSRTGGQGRLRDLQDDAINDVQACVTVAGEALIGAMLAQHHAEVCAGWWHSLTHGVSSAVKNVGKGVSSVANTAEHAALGTLKTLGPVIAVAAGAAATAMVGPEAAGIANSLTKSLVNAATGQGSVADVANQALAAATQAAQSDPTVAQALAAAKQAVAQTTAAAHVAQTIQSAASGNPAAKQQVLELTKAAAQGDPAAQGVVSAAQDLSLASGNLNASVTDATAAASDLAAADASDIATAVSGWFLPALLAGGAGYATGRWGGDLYERAKEAWHEHHAK